MSVAEPAPPAAAGSGAPAKEMPVPPPLRTVTGYSIPGEGPSTLISVVTVVALFALWWIATHFGWIRDIFLPTPEKIVTSFADAWRGDIQGGRPLLEHFWASLMRVFAAFLLAVITAIPAGIAMGVSRIARGNYARRKAPQVFHEGDSQCDRNRPQLADR